MNVGSGEFGWHLRTWLGLQGKGFFPKLLCWLSAGAFARNDMEMTNFRTCLEPRGVEVMHNILKCPVVLWTI